VNVIETPRIFLRTCAVLIERMARRAETAPWLALYRVGIGAGVLLAFTRTSDHAVGSWRLVPFLLLALLTLRVVPVVLRRILPFSDEARAEWSRRRLLAKSFDSYQWRKLLWVGLGIGGAALFVGQTDTVPGVVAVICLLAGGIGTLRWRRIARSNSLASPRRTA
jgi:hypothetical protein